MDTFGNLPYPALKAAQVAGAFVNDQALEGDDDVKNSKVLADISVVRIAEYVKEVVGKRSIPHGKKGAVVMKLDVEVIKKFSYLMEKSIKTNRGGLGLNI